MQKAGWKRKIIEQCEAVGTYKEAFLPVIETLANTLAVRDRVYKAFVDDGSRAAVAYTNKAGAENVVKNPLLVQWDDLNKSALGYWRDLGLTPAGLKKLDESAMRPQKRSKVEEKIAGVMKDLGSSTV